MQKLMATGGLSFVFLVGCSVEREWHAPQDPFAPTQDIGIGAEEDLDSEEDAWEDEWEDECWDCYSQPATFEVQGGHVGGDIGRFTNLDLPIATPYVYEDPSFGYTNINLTGYRADGDMGMIFMDLFNVSVGDLPEGVSECGTDAETGVQISVTGCASGDRDDEYYDAPAVGCEIEVHHGEAGTEISVTAKLPQFDANGAQVSETVASARMLAVPLE